MKLTKQQAEELALLAKQPRSTSNTRFDDDGKKRKNRARVQNSLMRMGLAYFCEEDGTVRELSFYLILGSYGNPRPQCRITEAGRVALATGDT